MASGGSLQENLETASPTDADLDAAGRDLLELYYQYHSHEGLLSEKIRQYDSIQGLDSQVRTMATQMGAQIDLDEDSDIDIQATFVDLIQTDLEGFGLPSADEIISMDYATYSAWFPNQPDDYDVRIFRFFETIPRPPPSTPGILEIYELNQTEAAEPGTVGPKPIYTESGSGSLGPGSN